MEAKTDRWLEYGWVQNYRNKLVSVGSDLLIGLTMDENNGHCRYVTAFINGFAVSRDIIMLQYWKKMRFWKYLNGCYFENIWFFFFFCSKNNFTPWRTMTTNRDTTNRYNGFWGRHCFRTDWYNGFWGCPRWWPRFSSMVFTFLRTLYIYINISFLNTILSWLRIHAIFMISSCYEALQSNVEIILDLMWSASSIDILKK